MMTLRIGPGRGNSPRCRDRGCSVPVPPRSGDTPTATERCPHCQQRVTTHRFIMGDGHLITTHHCAQHGDVIPVHGVIMHDE